MQGEVDEQQPNEIISEFGYYPVEVNIETEQFSLRTLPGLIEWICPYISRHLLSLNPLLACCRRYSRGER